MRDPDQFDDFYAATRDRLLLQTVALTGDVATSRAAVRDAYVAAWHHWRRVGGLPHPSSWVRRQAWAHVQPHPARLRGADDAGVRATLEALDTLTPVERSTLALHHLSALPLADLAAETGLSRAESEAALATATARYAGQRGVAPEQIGRELAGLTLVTSGVRWPRGAAVRRHGRARRRAYAVLGVAATLGVVAGAGVVLTDRDGASDLADARLSDGLPGAVSGAASRADTDTDTTDTAPATPRLQTSELVTAEQVARLDPDRTWTIRSTDTNRVGSGSYAPCQTARYADPQAVSVLVRSFGTQPPGSTSAVTAVSASELSASTTRATQTYDTTVGWYAACAEPRISLVHTWTLTRVGDQGTVLELRRGGTDPAVLTVGVARTGQVVTTAVRSAPGSGPARPMAVARVLGLTVGRLCGEPGAATCAGTPLLTPSAPLPLTAADGLLDAADLPQPSGGAGTSPGTSTDGTWSGTEPARATSTPAVIACDESDFSARPVRGGVSRTFVMLHSDLPDRFGVTENAGRLASPVAARAFVRRVRDRFATCEKRDLASTVVPIATTGTELAAWRVTTEIDDSTTVGFLTAVVRRGDRVAQLGFVVAPGAGYDSSTFLDVARRAADRLGTLPRRTSPTSPG